MEDKLLSLRLAFFLFFAFSMPLQSWAQPACEIRFANLAPAELRALALAEPDFNLFKEQMKIANPQEATLWNKALIEALNDLPKPAGGTRLADLTSEQRRKLLRKVDKHPVAASCHYDKYAPEGGIGFCFGRAITAHIEALRMGLDKESIKKIWIVGNMKGREINWGHHVATIVRGRDGRWYTIDPNYEAPLPLADWLAEIKSGFKNDGRLQLFATQPFRFGPADGADAGPILPSTVKDPFYNNYFTDLMAESRRDAKEMLEQKRLERGSCPITSSPEFLRANIPTEECLRKFLRPARPE